MKRTLKFSAIFVSFALAVALGWFLLIGKHMAVEKFELVLDPTAPHDWLFAEIKKDLEPKLEKFKGENLLNFSFERLSAQILKDPRVKAVFLRREFPAKVRVQILPHEPVLAWIDDRGLLHPVARDNKILPGLKSETFQDFALLRGNIFKTNSELRQKALDLMDQLPEEGLFRRALVSEIRFSKASGIELFLSEPSVWVRMGEGEIPEKSARVQKVLSYMQSREISGRVIDSRYQKKVVVRLRNEP